MKSRGTALIAGWSSPVARQAHNLKVVGSNPAPATKKKKASRKVGFFVFGIDVAFLWRGKFYWRSDGGWSDGRKRAPFDPLGW